MARMAGRGGKTYRLLAPAIATLSLGGCGLADAVTLGGGPPATDAQLLAVSHSIDGTPQERRARDYLEYATFQSRVGACAKASGVSYDPPVFLDPSGGLDREVLPDPVPAAALASVEQARATGLGAEARARHFRAMEAIGRRGAVDGPVPSSCGQNAAQGLEGVPAFAQGLSMRLTDLVSAAADKARVSRRDAKYGACLRSQGVQVTGEDEVVVELQAAADQLYVDDEIAPDTPAWEAARQKEIRMAVADAECRADDHTRYLKVLGPMLAEFERAHASEIAQVDRQWGQLPAKAERAQAAFRKAHPTKAPPVDFAG